VFVAARDRLRADPALARAYDAVKQAHADREDYRAAKAAFWAALDLAPRS
jgi:GrpB-like predicted nucleotidyltransferase (UPF0157 family)